jgi:hypothetical protein
LDESDYAPKPSKEATKSELERLHQYREKELARIYLSNFGECVVRAGPLESYVLLMTKTGSAEEQKSFSSLMPALSSCMSEGRTLELNKATIRGTIALNYYRLAHASRADITSAGATK